MVIVTTPYFGRYCHRVIVTISDNHCTLRMVHKSHLPVYRADGVDDPPEIERN